MNCATGPPAVSGGMWQPGTYPTDPQAGGTTHPFAPGVYVFCNGLTGDVTATSTGGSIGGTFFYFAGGSYNCETPPVGPNCSDERVHQSPDERSVQRTRDLAARSRTAQRSRSTRAS